MPAERMISHLMCLDCRRMIPVLAWKLHKTMCLEKQALYAIRVKRLTLEASEEVERITNEMRERISLHK